MALRSCIRIVICLLLSVQASLVSVRGQEAIGPPAIDPDEARLKIRWQDAEHLVGRDCYVYGQIVSVSSAGQVHFLNFETGRSDRFTVVIFAHSLPRFKDSLAALYEGKNVRVRGIIDTYRGKAQIKAADPSQIEVLTELPQIAAQETQKKTRNTNNSEITVASYNILNLFDNLDDPYHTDESTPTKPKEQLEPLAKSIRALDADVLAMEEVEDRGYLERFIQVFLPDMGYEHVVFYEGNDLRGIDVCVVSRLPVGPVTSYRHVVFPDDEDRLMRFRRDLISVSIEPPNGKPFELWVVHLKSNSEGRPQAEPIRLGEARKIRQLLDQRFRSEPSARIIIGGDFNDTWDSESLTTIVGSGNQRLSAFFQDVPESARITYNKEPHRSMIDFLLASPAMAEDYVAGSYKIPQGSVESSGSDHNPVVARFRIAQ